MIDELLSWEFFILFAKLKKVLQIFVCDFNELDWMVLTFSVWTWLNWTREFGLVQTCTRMTAGGQYGNYVEGNAIWWHHIQYQTLMS